MVLGSFGVSSDNDPDCLERCAVAASEAERGTVWTQASTAEGDHWAELAYEPETSQAALTWSCTWYGEDKYPGAKPDGCEDKK